MRPTTLVRAAALLTLCTLCHGTPGGAFGRKQGAAAPLRDFARQLPPHSTAPHAAVDEFEAIYGEISDEDGLMARRRGGAGAGIYATPGAGPDSFPAANFAPVVVPALAAALPGVCRTSDGVEFAALTWPQSLFDTIVDLDKTTATGHSSSPPPFPYDGVEGVGDITPFAFCGPLRYYPQELAAEKDAARRRKLELTNQDSLMVYWAPQDCWPLTWLMGLAMGQQQQQQGKGGEKGLLVDVGVNMGLCSLPLLGRGHRVVGFEGSATSLAHVQQDVAAMGAAERFKAYNVVVSNVTKGVVFLKCAEPNPCAVPYQIVAPPECNAPGLRLPRTLGQPSAGEWGEENPDDIGVEEILQKAPGLAKVIEELMVQHRPLARRFSFAGEPRCMQSARLDYLLKDERHVHVMKIDVDGLELQALDGARALFLERRVDFAQIEVVYDEMRNSGTSWADFLQLVEMQYGYELLLLQSCRDAWKNLAWPRDFWMDYSPGPFNLDQKAGCARGECLALRWFLGPRLTPVQKRGLFDRVPDRDGGRETSVQVVAVNPNILASVLESSARISAQCHAHSKDGTDSQPDDSTGAHREIKISDRLKGRSLT